MTISSSLKTSGSSAASAVALAGRYRRPASLVSDRPDDQCPIAIRCVEDIAAVVTGLGHDACAGDRNRGSREPLLGLGVGHPAADLADLSRNHLNAQEEEREERAAHAQCHGASDILWGMLFGIVPTVHRVWTRAQGVSARAPARPRNSHHTVSAASRTV